MTSSYSAVLKASCSAWSFLDPRTCADPRVEKMGVRCLLYLRYNFQRILRSSCNQHCERSLKDTRSVSFRLWMESFQEDYASALSVQRPVFSSTMMQNFQLCPCNLSCSPGHKGFFFRWDALVCNLALFFGISSDKVWNITMWCHGFDMVWQHIITTNIYKLEIRKAQGQFSRQAKINTVRPYLTFTDIQSWFLALSMLGTMTIGAFGFTYCLHGEVLKIMQCAQSRQKSEEEVM